EQQWVTFLNKFLDRLPLTEMNPHSSWTSNGQLLAKPGSEYLAYSRNGGKVTLDLTHLTQSLPAEWLNPRAGTTHNAGMVTGGAERIFTPPFAGDWALHIGSGVQLDTIPPNPPVALSSPNQTMNSISLSWQAPVAASDGDIASHYLVVRQGIALATVQATSYIDTGLEESFTYKYKVFAIDDAGLKSPQPAALDVSTTGDTQPPNATELNVISTTELQVVFSEPVEPASAQNAANYQITPAVQIVSATLTSEGTKVTLKTALHTTGQPYSLQVSNVKDRARNPNTMAPPKTFTYTIEAKLQISELSPASYQVATLGLNSPYYMDRDYVLVQIPDICRNALWIKTENDDKTRSDAHWLSFKVNLSATVLVAFDTTTPLPAWLQSWRNTSAKLVTSDDAPLQVYEKKFPAGQVVLGANEGTDKSSMYVVVAKKSDTPVIDNTAPHVPQGFRFGE
ncbi:Ig-like domain-containing protein, partial [candidate division KSB1 bacterium]|nr:Ig-like domain-containing protein [candidate division KSB1 bacterium]